MRLPQLSTGIWEQVIDSIPIFNGLGDISDHYEISSSTLQACCLVCRSWLPRSQLRLLTRVMLSTSHQFQVFLTKLTRSPSLGQGVKTLIITRRFLSPLHSTTPELEPVGYQNWIYTAVATLPSFLTKLETLQFRALHTMHPIFIVLTSQFKSIRHLQLFNLSQQSFSEYVQLVNRFPQLQALSIEYHKLPKSGHCVPIRRCRLRQLVIGISDDDMGSGDALQSMLSSTAWLSAIEFLSISVSHTTLPDYTTMDLILQRCARTLRCLMLDFDATEEVKYGMWNNDLSGHHITDSR